MVKIERTIRSPPPSFSNHSLIMSSNTSGPTVVEDFSLFGGAITCRLPKIFVDVSTFRQVPDNQEVFCDKESERSIVIEILELEKDVTGNSARFFFKNMAEENNAIGTIEHEETLTSEALPHFGNEFPKAGCVGIHELSGQGGRSDKTRLFMVNIRLPQVASDIVITVNVPVTGDNDKSMAVEGGVSVILRDMLRSFRVVDWSLFG